MNEDKKTKYGLFCELLSEALGDNFDVKYYNNTQTEWDKILIDDVIHGTLLVTGGQTIRPGGELVKIDSIAIQLMLPLDAKVFYKVIDTLDTLLPQPYPKGLHNFTFEFEGDLVAFNYAYRTDSAKARVNGEEYAMVTIIGSLINYDKIVLAYNRTVKVNGESLNGIINTTYDSSKTTDGDVFGLDSPVQKNAVNGINKVLTIDIIWCIDDALHLKLMQEEDSLINYQIEYYNGILTRKLDMIMLKITENATSGDKLMGQLVFGIGDNEEV